MTDLTNKFHNEIAQIFAQQKLPEKIAIGVSGGCDSVALLFLLQDFCQKNNIKLFAVTIDHKIRENSTNEALELQNILHKNNIFHHILEIPNNKIPQSNIEANLREIRYELLHDFCQKNQVEFLFLGHIQSDIAENFIIRLFRGSGFDGLSSIAKISDYKNIKLVRPLLDITKDELKNFLQEKNIKWFEDETNKDEKFLRNKIRNFLDTFEEKDVICKRIKTTSDDISNIRDEFDDEMLKAAADIVQIYENRFITINIAQLSELEEKTALKILALTLMEIGQKPYKPRLEKLQRFYHWIIDNEDHRPRNFYNCIAKSYSENKIAIYNETNPHQKIPQLNTILKKIL